VKLSVVAMMMMTLARQFCHAVLRMLLMVDLSAVSDTSRSPTLPHTDQLHDHRLYTGARIHTRTLSVRSRLTVSSLAVEHRPMTVLHHSVMSRHSDTANVIHYVYEKLINVKRTSVL